MQSTTYRQLFQTSRLLQSSRPNKGSSFSHSSVLLPAAISLSLSRQLSSSAVMAARLRSCGKGGEG